ncbi:hypothetical protein B9J07_27970 [Sinorhizobium sp. LM21]|uniref:hypothetical protein n=1 Tax=Sinorhizobium sp. LM21 TaxID=1449788 RepID=UPI0005D76CD1|nr:hypothetical protein [Sinorhizobium sp. LM21]AJW30170.1 hypothetical protein pLM21S1_p50 [Sinorhizobium sp. LM21]OWZ90427.1 hypothetical protein B9J07_27970 [Sinorhizobium sp. LM21]
MPTAAATNAMPHEADLASLDAVLADFDLEATNEEDVILDDEGVEDPGLEAVVNDEQPTELAADELADLDLAIAKNEAYAEQTSAAIDTTELPAPTAAKTKGARAPRAASASTGAARTPRDISKVADEFFVLSGDPAAMSTDDLAAARAATMALKPNQVKIAEKFENLFTALSAGKAPSTYVMIAFGVLESKGSMTSSDVVGAYKASGLGEGTARSQSGQIMNLFATVGIATRSGQTLTLRSDSKLAERLRSLPVPAAS